MDEVTREGHSWLKSSVAPILSSLLHILMMPLIALFLFVQIQQHFLFLATMGSGAIAALFALTFFFGSILGAWQMKANQERKIRNTTVPDINVRDDTKRRINALYGRTAPQTPTGCPCGCGYGSTDGPGAPHWKR